jgi:pyridoxal phosphate enzyme (YggS family)
MAVNKEAYQQIISELTPKKVTLVAVSKIRPVSEIMELYNLGQRDFGENYVQELVDKAAQLPKDINWHFIGHLQSNKVKYIAPFVHLIHGVDSLNLLKEINKQGAKNGRIIDILLQVHIAQEETKFGLDEEEVNVLMGKLADVQMPHVQIFGLMGMASFSEDMEKVRAEFKKLKGMFDSLQRQTTKLPTGQAGHKLQTLSMGMSADYKIAIEEGSTMVRIGSILFGMRN